jgi:hypothetical protein
MLNAYDNYGNWGLIMLQLLLPMAIDIPILTGKDNASILQCLQQMTYYIPIPTGKDQIYYNVCKMLILSIHHKETRENNKYTSLFQLLGVNVR